MKKPGDLQALELAIAKFLRWGALTAGGFLLVGWLLGLQRGGDPFVKFHDHIASSMLANLDAAVTQRDWGMLIAYAGLLILISLPILRVALTAVLFLRGGERILAAAAAFVLATLALSFALGFEI